MSTKQIVRDLLDKMPDEASLQEIAQRIEFVAAVREGIDAVKRGESLSIEDVERGLNAWPTK